MSAKTPEVGETTRMCIRRTISTAPYETVTVEVEETYTFTTKQERSDAYKALSKTVEGMVGFEERKYGRTKR